MTRRELAVAALESAENDLEKYTEQELLEAAKFFRGNPADWSGCACVAITAVLLKRQKDRHTQ